jgi:hypothetical protein
MNEEKSMEAVYRENINYESLTSLENKAKKLENTLGQIISQSNKVYEVVHEKKHKINQVRNERVIDSAIFRNLEKELRDSELSFKKLMIEKTKYQS